MSISIDYIFNRVYDVLLWFKYTWLFTILRTEPEKYVRDVEYRDWDGLRDRGWFDEYFAAKSAAVPESGSHVSMWQRLLESTGYKLPDSDLDGIPDVTDTNKYDSNKDGEFFLWNIVNPGREPGPPLRLFSSMFVCA
jgi:hypothetical protein